jgi:SNF2 family DNA or RNA helicase
MLTPDLLHDYQKKAVNFQSTHPNSMLWLDMGLGKTVITLTTLAHLIRTGFLKGVVIVDDGKAMVDVMVMGAV